MRRIFFVSTLGLISLFASAASAGSGATPSKTTASATHSRPSDAELEHLIRAKLLKSKIGKDGFTVRVKSGVVTWDGKTNVMQHKGAATRMARTAGAVEVVNNIKISDEARQKAVGDLTGAPKRAQVTTN